MEVLSFVSERSIDRPPSLRQEAAKRPVNFVVGQSDPAKDWCATQLAVLASAEDAKTLRSREPPGVINFSIDSPKANYRLHLSLLIESASVPALRVGINGKQGVFDLHPKLDYSNGDQTDSFYPAYSQADVSFPIPAGYLQQGTNTITLQAIEEADEKVLDAGLTYDAIELDRGSTDSNSQASSARIESIAFVRKQYGELLEVVDAFIRYGERFKPETTVNLSVAGKPREEERGVADLRQPFLIEGRSFLAGTQLDPARETEFILAVNWKSRLGVGYCFRRCDFPWMAVWEENHSRQNSPWNGTTAARGMEFGTTPLPFWRTRSRSAQAGFRYSYGLRNTGTGKKTAKYLIFLFRVPLNVSSIDDVGVVSNAITVYDDQRQCGRVYPRRWVRSVSRTRWSAREWIRSGVIPMRGTWRWFGPRDAISLEQIKQTGATGIVTALHHLYHGEPWPVEEVLKCKAEIEAQDLVWSVVESIPVHNSIKLRSGPYNQYIGWWKESLRAIGKASIGIVCYNFMPAVDWTRTDLMWRLPSSGYALRFDVLDFAAYDLFILKRDGAEADYSDDRIVSARERFDHMMPDRRNRLEQAIIAGLPAAEAAYDRKTLAHVLSEYRTMTAADLTEQERTMIF